MTTFTDDQLELLFCAWVADQDGGKGIVIQDACYPDADMLAEQGWLRREFIGNELAWFWTPTADAAFSLSELMNVEGREN